jgi:5'-3' exoribonuclease 2
MQKKDNLKAAMALKKSLNSSVVKEEANDADGATAVKPEETSNVKEEEEMHVKMEEEEKESIQREKEGKSGKKRKAEEHANEEGVGVVGDAEDEFDQDDDDDEDEEMLPIKIEVTEDLSPEVAAAFKERVKNEQQKKLDEYSRMVEDKVRLHEKGWKDRYYSDKCKADDVEKSGGREELFRSYIMGLCWVMKYYYEGCVSWKWYFPFHYAPFASDLRNIERFQKNVKSFELNTPFSPVEQLMAVLPSDSVHAIPKASRWLMTDPESPIIDFYPTDVPVDPNGKAMPWLWVVLLPFIDEVRLLDAM